MTRAEIINQKGRRLQKIYRSTAVAVLGNDSGIDMGEKR